MLTQQAIAEHLDLSQPEVSGWMEKLGIDWKTARLDDIRVAYIRRLRETAAGRATEGGMDLATERARLAREQADRIAMQNAVTRRELAPVSLLEQILARTGTRVASILDGIAPAIKRRLPDMPSAEYQAIQAEVAKARNTAAAMSLADLDDDGDAPDDAPTEVDA